MERIKTVLIGAGNIAGMKQTVDRNSRNIVTHIQAILKMSDRFEVVGVVDSDIIAAETFIDKWNLDGVHTEKCIADIPCDFDFVVIATNPDSHFCVVSDVFNCSRPKMMLLEKPGGRNIEDALEIDRLCKSADCKLYLNYQRNYAIDIRDFQLIGKIKAVECNYVRGVMNDASHAIALLLKLFGTTHEFSSSNEPIVSKNVITDKQSDPTLSAFLKFSRLSEAVLIGHDGRDYDIFEMKFWGDNGVITLGSHGSRFVYQPIVQEEIYGNYKKLSEHCIPLLRESWNEIGIERVYETIFHDYYFEEYTECVDYIGVWHIINKIFLTMEG